MTAVPLLNLEASLKNISRYMAFLELLIKADNALGLFDKNRIAEDVLIPLFREVYEYNNLVNLNTKGETYPGIDLGDVSSRVAFQISSDVDSAKVRHTLEMFTKYEYFNDYDRVIIYDLTEKQGTFSETGWEEAIDGKFTFSKENDIQDYRDLLRVIRHLDIEKVQRVESILERHFTDRKVSPTELVSRHLARQIVKEKNSKKYIPDVFVEVSDVKDNARFFSHPILFFGKLVDELSTINLDEVNYYLGKLSLPLIEPTWQVPDLSELTLDNIDEYVDTLDKALTQVQVALSPYGYPYTTSEALASVPEGKEYVYESMKYRIGAAGSPLIRQVGKIIENLELIRARVLLVIGRAGQGKTNFVCDLAERTLLNNGIPVLLFTGREFNHIEPEKIDFYFVKSVFGDAFNDLEAALAELNALALRMNRPISVIVDGINEHKQIQAFSHFLEKLIERILIYPNIKIILTCREEYFEERFRNFRVSSFSTAIHFIHNLGHSMNELHKKQMVRGYLRFFKLEPSFVSSRAAEVLEKDTLLLRMFCEAYGNINAQETIRLPALVDIYREKVFKEYLRRKIESAAEYEEDHARIRLAPGNAYRQVLRHIIQTMIERKQFSDISVSDVPAELHEAAASLVGEDVIVRKDLVDVKGVLDTKVEVINFTFDEFRDFLLADHLVNVMFGENPESFEQIVDEMVIPTSPVAEGVRTYLFFASKQDNRQDVRSLLENKDWYKEIFIKSIFSVEEELLTTSDLDQIKAQFRTNAYWIITMLYWRWRPSLYPRLNIYLLFEILKELDEMSFDEIVRPLARRYGGLDVDRLANQLSEALTNKEFADDIEVLNLIELMIFFFDVWDLEANVQPAFRTFGEFARLKPDAAMTLLRKHTNIKQIGLCSQVWRMLTIVIKTGIKSEGLIEEACRVLEEVARGDQQRLRPLGVEIVRFLETAGSQENVNFETPIATLMAQYSVFPYSYGVQDDSRT